jgi:cytochrome c
MDVLMEPDVVMAAEKGHAATPNEEGGTRRRPGVLKSLFQPKETSMTRIWLLPAALMILASTIPAFAAGDAANGEKVFNRCKACHTVEQGKNRVGPSLFGVVGRKAGTEPGFAYSDAMKNSGMTWTEDSLEKYLADPKAAVPGNKMAFPGVKDEKERDDVIAYLKTQGPH